MAALVLCLSVFAFLALVGYAILSLLAFDEEPVYRLLLAPVTGAAATMICIFLVNQLGVPVERFGLALSIALILASVAILWRRGQRVPARDLWPFAILSVLAVLATGWPMLKFGLDWVSFCNDDMANYCMGAERLLRHGYYEPPDTAALAGADYTQFTWFLHVLHRPGSELFMAMVSAATRVQSLRLFMPVVLAFTLCQISAAAAMTFAAGRSRLAAWLVWGLMSLSALVALGTLYQLIAQVIGLGMAAGLVSVLMRPLHEVPDGARFRHGALIGLLLAGLLLAYTEALPFVALSYILYVVATARWDWAAWRRVMIVLAAGALVVVVLLNRFVPLATVYVLSQAQNAQPEDPATTMFPYYMMPSGPVYFWGLFAIGRIFPADSVMSTYIVIAILLCAVTGVVAFRSLRSRQAPAFVCAVMFVVWVWLFYRHSGFGMYKLAMYFQPFALSAAVLGWMSLWRSRAAQVAPLVLLGLGNVSSHRFYTESSLGMERVFSEIPAASSTHIVREYAGLLQRYPGRPLELDTFNGVLAKFQMIESSGRPATFPSKNFLGNLTAGRAYGALIGQGSAATGLALADAYNNSFPRRDFDMHPADPASPDRFDPFVLVLEGRAAVAAADTPGHPLLFVAANGHQVGFNRWHDPEESVGNFRAGGLDGFHDHLIFTASELGQPYFLGGVKRVAIYQLEPDIVFKSRTMASVGRYLLFQVVNPSPRCRLKLDVTDTFTGDGENRLPPAEAVGATRARFPMTGRGSARVFSAPFAPQLIDGCPFVALDMGTDGTYVTYAPGGLMRLWGRKVRLDRRQLVGFCRDISLVSDDDYRTFRAPSIVEKFPQDLGRPTLEYSGMYEDGYVSDRLFVGLSQPPGVTRLAVEGIVPLVLGPTFTTEAVLSVDGKEVARKTLPVGEFEMTADVPFAPDRRKVEMSFSRYQNLPNGDGRPCGAQLTRIGFLDGPSTVTWSLKGPSSRDLQYTGIFLDGWMPAESSVRVTQPADAPRLVVRGMVPKISNASFSTDIVLKVDGSEVARKPVGVGDFEIDADLPPVPDQRAIEIAFSKLQSLPPPDMRSVGAQLKSIGFEPRLPGQAR